MSTPTVKSTKSTTKPTTRTTSAIDPITHDVIFFWSETDKYSGYMSNFYKTNFVVDDILYCCSEQYFMKKKQEYFDPSNIKLAIEIMEEDIPYKIKKLGRSVRYYNDKEWASVRVNIMKDGIRAKFQQKPELRVKLLATGEACLAEASPYDAIWGLGMSAKDALLTPMNMWKGKNLLGIILMELRRDFTVEGMMGSTNVPSI